LRYLTAIGYLSIVTMINAPIVPGDNQTDETLKSIERRVLWLATSMIHHANRVRASGSGLKVGGHQASSASMVSIMTALYFDSLAAEDRVSVKPHASPVLHAINYLLGNLDRAFLTELRAFHGLQSYPSRTKDPDPVDFSTGSVGIGGTATIWSALSHRYLTDHFDVGPAGRHIALLGDAELDEGAIWEALVDPMVSQLGEVLWVIDLNRQSLDRVVPNISAARLEQMFEAVGWQTLTVKYGRRLRELFARPGGDALLHRIDQMSNGEYQRLLRTPADSVRERLCSDEATRPDLLRLLADLEDMEVAEAIRDLGGHDLADLRTAFATADATRDRPTVILAYTIKAWSLPTEGHPGNHSSLLTDDQWVDLGHRLGASSTDPWARFAPGSAEAEWCASAASRLQRQSRVGAMHPAVPTELGRSHTPIASTQQTLGRILVDLARVAPAVSERVVTVSPDVASSTNLGAWINRVGVWSTSPQVDWFSDDTDILMHWQQTPTGQHIELGIAEGNLVGLLGELGATWSRAGQPLLPIGTIYDPFVTRALEPWSFGMYAGGQSILIGTPSGVTLAPEGGAHQSVITPSVGLEQPTCVAWEPCFGQDLEWTLLHALSHLGVAGGHSSYFRLSTRPIDQSLAAIPDAPAAREQRRRHVVSGGFVLSRAATPPAVCLVGMGVVMPEVAAAAAELARLGVAVDVVCVTSADLLFRAMQARNGLTEGNSKILDVLFPASRSAPMVTVLDGHPHTLSFLAAIHGSRLTSLGVDDFGQVGDIDDLYRHFGIDTDTIIGAAWDLLDGPVLTEPGSGDSEIPR
jgi:pyruvate dehydrogenase E1 component